MIAKQTDQRAPRRVLFLLTSMPVGGAETLLVNLVRRIDRDRFQPLIGCLKEPGELGQVLQSEGIPLFSRMIRGKHDVRVLGRLVRLFREQSVEALVTVGAGDKMFWGRIAARIAGVPVVLSALHSTGWPDGVGRLNRLLTPWTDGFIAVARSHGEFLVEFEKFPREKVFVIPNGIDTDRFRMSAEIRTRERARCGIPDDAPVVGIVAALRPEKNHLRFLRIARQVLSTHPTTHFVIAGDGPLRPDIETALQTWPCKNQVHMMGTVSHIPAVLSMLDVFLLTSDNEASPVSIIEAMACELPVIAPRVGSVAELVGDGETGWTFTPADESIAASRVCELIANRETAIRFGKSARDRVTGGCSLNSMTEGYEILISNLLAAKESVKKQFLGLAERRKLSGRVEPGGSRPSATSEIGS